MEHTVKYWLFDLDDTLYSATTDFFAQVTERITECIANYLHITADEARDLRRRYWKEYGTSLRGMMIHHHMDPEPFLRYVHDVKFEEVLKADAAVHSMILRCTPGRRFIFTNSPREHAERVLKALALEDLFEQIFDIRHSDYIPKPHRHAYEKVLEALGCSPADCLMIDDAPQNLVTARECGIRTVWLHSSTSEAGQAIAAGVQLTATPSPADYTITRLLELESTLSHLCT